MTSSQEISQRETKEHMNKIVKEAIMKNQISNITISLSMILFSLIMQVNILHAQTDIPAGNVSGTWALANSPYQINGEITVPNGDTLIIEPGVEVLFTGHYKFNVQGRLLAIGTKEDTITFTAQDTAIGWHGIKLNNVSGSNDSTIFEYCMFQYGKANTGSTEEDRVGGAIYSNFSKLRISHCLFLNNMTYHENVDQTGGGAIGIVGGTPIVEYCEFIANTSPFATAMILWYGTTKAQIRNNYFHDNNGHGTINIGAGAAPKLTNNLIENNYSPQHGIIHFSNSSGIAVLINNTIVNNNCAEGGAVFVDDGSTPLFINNIIYGNEPAQLNLTVSSGLDFYNCLIEGGRNGFTGANFSGTYQNCIDEDPEFAGSNDFHIMDNSPCISTGADSVMIGSTWYIAPQSDIEGNPRPSPASTTPDMGAFENPTGYYNPPTALNEKPQSDENRVQLFQNYPNPFSSLTTITFSLPSGQPASLKIYNMQGREVGVVVDEVWSQGNHTVILDAKELMNGVYFYKLITADYIQTRKCIVVK
jgi:hypothetical protein